MNKKLLITLLLAVLTAGCAHHGARSGDKVVNQTNLQIRVEGDQIRVPYSLIFLGRKKVTVTWHLQPNPYGYRFDERNGIVIEGVVTDQVIREERVSVVLDTAQDEIVDCKPGADGQTYSCVNKHTKAGYYKYTIRLVGTSKNPLTLDPGIMND